MKRAKYYKSNLEIDKNFNAHKRFVVKIMNQVIRSHGFTVNNAEIEDLVQVGLINLLELYRKFDDSHGIPFHNYAKARIQFGYIDWFRKNPSIPRRDQALFKEYNKALRTAKDKGESLSFTDIAKQLGISTDKLSAKQLKWESRIQQHVDEVDEGVFHANEDFNPESFFIIKENETLISEAIGMLSKREQDILSLYYYKELPLKDIAGKVGLTESRVSQIKNEAIIKIKKRIG